MAAACLLLFGVDIQTNAKLSWNGVDSSFTLLANPPWNSWGALLPPTGDLQKGKGGISCQLG